ncbi:phage tail protein [Leptothoe spongobia]|uniref:Phage tail protein n=1 Tax=Leptothoe spongobia TAU-MAC 1115 TaxID=1967444 RepID=A0A947DEM1_9CYAN|nr:phage tail protein [Leptothoe spongobia]MBT9314481.1 phage tail protein [Leptothoe spongobia TAU-MAC 1115]
MSNAFPIPALSLTENPPVGCYFMVTFLIGGFLPNLLDIRFQSVSGISSTMETTEIREGGENLFSLKLPTRMTYGNLVLTRGMVVGSPLNVEFNLAMSTMSFQPGNVLVMLLNAKDTPVASWLFQETFPVQWSVSDLNADQSAIMIDSMELNYARLQSLRI